MANFKYNPPTRDFCPVCVEISETLGEPIIDRFAGQASSANDYPIHKWFYFVLGYTPTFPDFILDKELISEGSLVVDPFMGTGTTLVCASQRGMRSIGIDANDFFERVASIKARNWVYQASLEKDLDNYLIALEKRLKSYKLQSEGNLFQDSKGLENFEEFASRVRPDMMVEKYINDVPLAKLTIAMQVLSRFSPENPNTPDLLWLAINKLIVPSSNVRYGPGFGITKKGKRDIDIVRDIRKTAQSMLEDIKISNPGAIDSVIIHGDSRKNLIDIGENNVDIIITSPPYPGDHEYTKHTRLELIFNRIANTKGEFQSIKRRMIRSSTTNMYKEDFDREGVLKFESIKKITSIIQERLDADGATSGFEKLYTKLVWEYFGGMRLVMEQALHVLKPGSKMVMLVSDSHAFKMVHIRTAKILEEIALDIGFTRSEIILWQNKKSTSHSYNIPEEIVTLTK